MKETMIEKQPVPRQYASLAGPVRELIQMLEAGAPMGTDQRREIAAAVARVKQVLAENES